MTECTVEQPTQYARSRDHPPDRPVGSDSRHHGGGLAEGDTDVLQQKQRGRHGLGNITGWPLLVGSLGLSGSDDRPQGCRDHAIDVRLSSLGRRSGHAGKLAAGAVQHERGVARAVNQITQRQPVVAYN